MYSIFETKFEVGFEELIEDITGCAHFRIRKNNPIYAEKQDRIAEIHETLENLIEDKYAEPTLKHWDMVGEYFNLEMELYGIEQTATYVQGVIDCFGMLKTLGWVK